MSLTSALVFGVDVRVYEQEVIVVPVLLLASFLGTLIVLLLLRYCPERVDRIRTKTSGKSQRSRRNLQGIDGEYRGKLVRRKSRWRWRCWKCGGNGCRHTAVIHWVHFMNVHVPNQENLETWVLIYLRLKAALPLNPLSTSAVHYSFFTFTHLTLLESHSSSLAS